MKINRLGLTLLVLNAMIVFGIAIADGLLSTFTVNPTSGPSEMRFLSWMMMGNFFPFLAYSLVAKIPILNWLYFKTYWTTCLHFAVLGGIQWYLIGWMISSIWNKFVLKK